MTEPQTFRKKPVTVQVMGPLSPANLHEIAEWCNGKALEKVVAGGPRGSRGLVKAVIIKTLEGDMKAGYGWWIIRGVAGEFYPCRGDVFDATYEAVDHE